MIDRIAVAANRRAMIVGAGASLGAAMVPALPAFARAAADDKIPFAPPIGPRARVVLVNDLAADVAGQQSDRASHFGGPPAPLLGSDGR